MKSRLFGFGLGIGRSKRFDFGEWVREDWF